MPKTRTQKPTAPKKSRRAKTDGHEVVLGRSTPTPASSGLRSFHSSCRGVAAIFLMSAAASRRSKSNALRARIASSQTSQQSQRAAVRVTYIKAKSAGHWKAHGVYIQREAATGLEKAGFNEAGQGIDIPTQLEEWQTAGDERIFRIIISPEEGTRLDMQRYAET